MGPFTMPHIPQVMSTVLSTLGYQQHERLGQQLLKCAQSLAKQCSKQPHYDFTYIGFLKQVADQGRIAMSTPSATEGLAQTGWKDEQLGIATALQHRLCFNLLQPDRDVLQRLIEQH